jgi:uncharacterized protein involved in exopolysaccharide biosynthesis
MIWPQMQNRWVIILGYTLSFAGLAACGVGLWLLLSPAQYRATARIEVNDEMIWVSNTEIQEYLKVHPERQIAFGYEIDFPALVIFRIQSDAFLSNFVAQPKLNDALRKKCFSGMPLNIAKSIAFIRNRLRFARAPYSRFIQISFCSEDPEVAAGVANALAKACQNDRMEIGRQNRLNGIKAMEDELQKEQSDIQAKQKNLEQLGKQFNVPNPEPAEELLKTNYPPYFHAKQELQKKLDFHKILQDKINSEKSNFAIPKTTMVYIIDVAQPPKLPGGPNRLLGVGLLFLGLCALCGSWRLIRFRPK